VNKFGSEMNFGLICLDINEKLKFSIVCYVGKTAN